MLDECAILFFGIKKDSVKSISTFYTVFRLCNAHKTVFQYCFQITALCGVSKGSVRVFLYGFPLLPIGCFHGFFPVPEEQGDAPDGSQSDQGVDDAADNGRLAAEEPSHQVELEEADAAPVQAADDDKDQTDSVQHG